MTKRHPALVATLLLAAGLLAACGESNTADPPASSVVTGPNSFLLFPNPQEQADGSYQTNTTAYAQAYYAAIDPTNAKDTLDKWRAANGFDSGTGTQTWVVFHDQRDLGYGRRMTARRNADGTVAVMVENYSVSNVPDGSYSSINVDAAIAQDQRWHIGTNGIEFSPGPNGQVFAKFYTFSPTTGDRVLTADLDGRGQKAMPGICISCHGGRADPLTAAGTFPNGGNTRARLQPLDVGSFGYSSIGGYTRADLEPKLKTINQMVLCTYMLAAATTFPEDACRPLATATTANTNEWANQWQSTAAEMLKSWYGGDGMPAATYADNYVPAGWVGQETLYNGVVKPYCRTCHVMRGTGNQNDIDFTTYAKFEGYADRIKAHVIDRGNMPLGLLVSQNFWSSSAPEILATFLENHGYSVRDGSGAVLRPGRPIADPGPDRTTTLSTTLSGTNSLYASTYNWSIVSTEPGSAVTLTNAATATPTLTTNMNGTYVLQLVVGNGSVSSAPAQVTLTVNSALSPAPSAIRFADIRAVLQSSIASCTLCHSHLSSTGAAGTPPWEPLAYTPPIFYTDYNRGGTSGTAGDGIYTANSTDDDYWFYLMLRGRINFTDVAASPLLRKPTGHHHGGGVMLDFNNPTACTLPCTGYATYGDWYRAQYNMIVNWILNGAPF